MVVWSGEWAERADSGRECRWSGKREDGGWREDERGREWRWSGGRLRSGVASVIINGIQVIYKTFLITLNTFVSLFKHHLGYIHDIVYRIAILLCLSRMCTSIFRPYSVLVGMNS